MKLHRKSHFLTKSMIQATCLAFVCVVAVSFAGGYLTDYLLRHEAIRTEGKRLAQFVELFVEQEFDEGIFANPESKEASSKYSALAHSAIFIRIVQMVNVGVWGPDGKLIWWFGEHVIPPSQFSEKTQEGMSQARNGFVQQFLLSSSRQNEADKPTLAPHLVTFIPLKGKEKNKFKHHR